MTDEPAAREMSGLMLMRARFYNMLTRLRRKLPYIVWYGQELDVGVTFSQDRLPDNMTDTDDPFSLLFGGTFFDIEKQLRHLGIDFDTGMGGGGRDWEWDWSLSGPISVRFRSRAKRPELRVPKERPALKLVS